MDSKHTYEEILGLIKAISDSGLDEVTVENGYKIKVKRQQEIQIQQVAPMAVASVPMPAPAAAPVAPAAQPAAAVAPAPVAETAPAANQLVIKSSMVGTFYRAPSPQDPDFVKEGDVIKKGQVVGIIEAMKLFNEIESEVAGKIVKILVDNATPVEFDQPLMIVEA